MSQIGVLGMKISEPNTICKLLYFAPKKFSQMTCSIETLLEHDTLTVEELIGQLKAVEERYELRSRRPSKPSNCSSLEGSGSLVTSQVFVLNFGIKKLFCLC
jgi:hypothetical protein